MLDGNNKISLWKTIGSGVKCVVLISKMQNGFFLLSPAAAAFFSSMLFLGDMDSAAAVILAAAVHEMSHLLMLVVHDYRITSIEMNMNGLCIRYAGKEDMTSKFLSNISGPLGGVIFYMLEKLPAAAVFPPWLILSCRVSLFLSLFNLMPVFPLDGGYCGYVILGLLMGFDISEKIIKALGVLFSVMIITVGLAFMANDLGIGAMTAGMWLLCANISCDDL